MFFIYKNGRNGTAGSNNFYSVVRFWPALAVVGVLVIALYAGLGGANRSVRAETATVATYAQQLQSLTAQTRELLNAVHAFQTAVPEDKEAALVTLREKAVVRRDTVRTAIFSDPFLVLGNTISQSVRQRLPDDIQAFVEERVTLRGEFLYEHADYFDSDRAEETYFVKDSVSGRQYSVHFTKGDVRAQTGDTVVVGGVALGADLAAESNSLYIMEEAAVVQNERKVAAIIVNFPTRNFTGSPDTIRQRIFDTADDYFRENSFNKWGFVGAYSEDGSADVFGPYTISFDGSSCSTVTIRSQADAIAQAAGIDMSQYNSRVYFFPSISSCGFSGSASVGGTYSYVNMNGGTSQGVITHELGHNMGAHHASSLSCYENGVKVPIVESPSTCSLGEYGDPFDVMGSSGGMKHFNNYHKGIVRNSLGWLDTFNTYTIDRNTQPDNVYTVVPIEWQSGGVQSLRIPVSLPDTSTINYYYIEFRQPYGFDNFSSTNPVVNGVTIRLSLDYNSSTKSRLIDTTPGTSTFSDATLLVGKTFTDPYRGVNITVVGVSASGAQVRVYFGSQQCTHTSPTVSISPAFQNGLAGGTLGYSYILTNNDSSVCPLSQFNVTSSVPASWTVSPSAFPDEFIAPGSSVERTFNVTSSGSASESSYNVSVSAQNSADTSKFSSAYALYNVITPDITPPEVTIIEPLDGDSVSKGNMTVSADAFDENGISLIVLKLDGSVIGSCSNTTYCSVNVSTNSLSDGNHLVSAEATDKGLPLGNTSVQFVTVTKQPKGGGGGGGKGGGKSSNKPGN